MALPIQPTALQSGGSSPLVLPPYPIEVQTAPTSATIGRFGQLQIDTNTDLVYCCMGRDATGYNWAQLGGSTFTATDLTINPGPTDITGRFRVHANTNEAGAIFLETTGGLADTIAIANTLGSAQGSVNVSSTSGGIVLSSGYAGVDAIELVATDAAAGGILLTAGAGGIELDTTGAITFSPGTATSFVVAAGNLELEATTGSVVVTAGEAVADAIQLQSSAGGIDADAALQINIASSQNAADAIRLVASAGGIDVDAVGSAGEDINLTNTGGSIVLSATEADAAALRLQATAGGLDVDTALQINLASSQNAGTAISLNASAGGIELQAQGAAGEDIVLNNVAGSINLTPGEAQANALRINTAGGIDSDSVLGVNFTDAGAAGVDISLVSTAGSINLNAGEASADAINIDSTGGFDLDAALQVNITSSQNSASAISVNATNGGMAFLATGAAAEDITITNSNGSVALYSGEAIDNAIRVTAALGGIDISAQLPIDIITSDNSASAIQLSATAGTIDMNAGNVTMDANGSISLDATAASNFSVSGAAVDLSLISAAGSVIVQSGEAAADAVRLIATDAAGGVDIDSGTGGHSQVTAGQMLVQSTLAAAANSVRINASAADGGIDVDAGTGGITIDTTGAISIDSAVTSNFTVTGAAQDLGLFSSGGSVLISSNRASAVAIALSTTDVAGGINVATGTGGTTFASTGVFSVTSADSSIIGGTNNLEGSDASASAVLISASNAAGGITLDAGATPGVTLTNGTQSAQILVGTGSPNGVVSAAQGSIFLNVAGTGADSLYVNTNGISAWTALS